MIRSPQFGATRVILDSRNRNHQTQFEISPYLPGKSGEIYCLDLGHLEKSGQVGYSEGLENIERELMQGEGIRPANRTRLLDDFRQELALALEEPKPELAETVKQQMFGFFPFSQHMILMPVYEHSHPSVHQLDELA